MTAGCSAQCGSGWPGIRRSCGGGCWPASGTLGTAFGHLRHVDGLPAHLSGAATAASARVREDALAGAYVALAERHNRASLTEPLPPTIGGYHSRPARVLMADRFTDALLATIDDAALRRLPLIGGIDQHTDSTDVLDDPRVFRRTAALYADADHHHHPMGRADDPRPADGQQGSFG
jgi:hypothetical protein